MLFGGVEFKCLNAFVQKLLQLFNTISREAKGAVLPLTFHCDVIEVKRLLCGIAKVSVVLVSLSLSAVVRLIPVSVGFDFSK